MSGSFTPPLWDGANPEKLPPEQVTSDRIRFGSSRRSAQEIVHCFGRHQSNASNTMFTGIARISSGRPPSTYWPPSAPWPEAAWPRISDRRRPRFSGRSTCTDIPGRRASPHGLMGSCLGVPRLAHADRPPAHGPSRRAVSPCACALAARTDSLAGRHAVE